MAGVHSRGEANFHEKLLKGWGSLNFLSSSLEALNICQLTLPDAEESVDGKTEAEPVLFLPVRGSVEQSSVRFCRSQDHYRLHMARQRHTPLDRSRSWPSSDDSTRCVAKKPTTTGSLRYTEFGNSILYRYYIRNFGRYTPRTWPRHSTRSTLGSD